MSSWFENSGWFTDADHGHLPFPFLSLDVRETLRWGLYPVSSVQGLCRLVRPGFRRLLNFESQKFQHRLRNGYVLLQLLLLTSCPEQETQKQFQGVLGIQTRRHGSGWIRQSPRR
ncbi:hypothetical protein VTK26DRAFT_338 [Humicola hyalothermophila]